MKTTFHPLIVFDMDGTLIDSLPDIGNSSRYLLQSYNLPSVNDETIRKMVGDGINILVKRLLTHAGDKAAFIDQGEATERFIAEYIPHSTQYSHPFDGAIPCLEEFKKQGWKIALCTNKITKAAVHILKQLKLDSYFDVVAGADSFAEKKPDPRHLEGIVRVEHADLMHTVMVGDHINDILVAQRAKIAGSIFARWGYGDDSVGKQATCQADSMEALPGIAQKIISGI